MANIARAALETALRARRLDRTLTTALPPLERSDAGALAATAVAPLDGSLRGGLPRGQLSEIVGPRSSGRTLLALQVIAAATRRGEIAALIDAVDRLDVASAAAAGVDLDRLLWVRGDAIAPTGGAGDRARPAAGGRHHVLLDRIVDRALKAFNLVLQAGGFGMVVLDVADVPLPALARIPFTTWLRVQRTIEGSDTACVLLAPQPLARSAGGVTLSLSGRASWAGQFDRSRRLAGLDVAVRLMSPRRRVEGDVAFTATATA